MSSDSDQTLIADIFLQLRRHGWKLGIAELLDALRYLDNDRFVASFGDIRGLLHLLWCKSLRDRSVFDDVYSDLKKLEDPSSQSYNSKESKTKPTNDGKDDIENGGALPSERIDTLPVKAPYTHTEISWREQLHTYWPLSRREMTYHWRFLRQLRSDGPADVLDVAATVTQVARQGFFLAPILRRRKRNHARLMMLVDQDGSMVPFHRFSRDLVSSARKDSDLENIEILFFHNVFTDTLYSDPHLTHPLAASQALDECDNETSLLVVSDAGSARGHRNIDRIRMTVKFLADLKRRTPLLAWLNPVPKTRWPGTSAQFVERFVSMSQMDSDGFSNAIDVIQGLRPNLTTRP